MITLQELCVYLDKLLEPSSIKDYGLNGLQVEGKKEILKLATAVSANLETLQAAVHWKADALLVHHGLFWNQDSYQIQGIKKAKLALLCQHNLSLIAYHLPLDIHPEWGNNWRAALEMGWDNLQPFGLANGLYLGVKGRLKKMSRLDFQKKLEDYYAHVAHIAPGGKEEIETVGLVAGGGYKFLSYAADEKLDAFVSGNFDEPAWSQAYEEKINFFAMGHSATERIGPRALAAHLHEKFQMECRFIDIYNPF
ncbi:Nif3-like dinuclear metal center hexameric protein [Neochlamydia sp. EPS4]|uniref:Nif3-like dinuclear metal center hexameric protein n=1 Tax=Neochlamydia sp. EPS4 TaxID=1478175 RepID=UPI000695057A|nr:Nif3-like dinuclear metal center hexameric protein [Neochlamydia sp. EPS4]